MTPLSLPRWSARAASSRPRAAKRCSSCSKTLPRRRRRPWRSSSHLRGAATRARGSQPHTVYWASSARGAQAGPRKRAGNCADAACNVVWMIAEIVPQPIGKRIRFALDAAGDLIDADEVDADDFRRIGAQARGEGTEIDIDEFVFLHAVAEIDLVAGEK